jgi:hypothetical protein
MELTLYLQVLQATVRGHGPCGADATDNSSILDEMRDRGTHGYVRTPDGRFSKIESGDGTYSDEIAMMSA